MASLKFLLQSKTAPANIYIQLSLGRGKVFKRKAGYTINPADWSNKKAMPINRDEVLKKLFSDLDDLRIHLTKRINTAVSNKIIVDGNWLQDEINAFHGLTPATDDDHLINHIQKIIDTSHRKRNAKGGLGISESRVKSYKTFKNTIIRFQADTNKGKDFILNDIDVDFSEKFTDWLFSKKYNKSYVGKNIDNLKAVCRDAQRRGLQTSNQVDLIAGFSELKDKDEIIILSEAEQEIIANTHLTSEALINARKWLLLGCQLGQRYSDLIRVNNESIKSTNGIKVVELTQQKTKKLVAIPLLPKAIEIIENGMPYPIALQNFNDYIKKVCKAAELNEPTKGSKILPTKKKSKNKPKTKGVYPKWQLIGSHVCRRSFATNFYGKIPTPILINITGHGTEKMFLKYIGKTAYDNAHQMMEYFGKLQAKEKNEPQLQVLKNAN